MGWTPHTAWVCQEPRSAARPMIASKSHIGPLMAGAGPACRRSAQHNSGINAPFSIARKSLPVGERTQLLVIGAGLAAYDGGPHEGFALGEGMAAHPRASTPLLRPLDGRLVALFPKARYVRVIRSWAGVIEKHGGR